ncbi:hypothetical protein H2O64_19345 [Kordia sp. YSTF-M3]|uniref:Natural product n=1 Tax=Kordia aestuariivivens TaxID=2759037 RepID=A0ABR7QEB3_9FLAO|nr:hypothetical protein [Kordia aestuariivivens]MBC8756838.1 hypothetical protein [Kordia aestuariivivens]
MKKKNLKSLTLTRKTISNLHEVLKGGAVSGYLSCKPVEVPLTQNKPGCNDTKVNWCDSRFGGCDSYYCPN